MQAAAGKLRLNCGLIWWNLPPALLLFFCTKSIGLWKRGCSLFVVRWPHNQLQLAIPGHGRGETNHLSQCMSRPQKIETTEERKPWEPQNRGWGAFPTVARMELLVNRSRRLCFKPGLPRHSRCRLFSPPPRRAAVSATGSLRTEKGCVAVSRRVDAEIRPTDREVADPVSRWAAFSSRQQRQRGAPVLEPHGSRTFLRAVVLRLNSKGKGEAGKESGRTAFAVKG